MPSLPIRNETDLQLKLIGDVEKHFGGHAFKAANRFKVGVLDLSVQLPDMAHCFIEVKYLRDGFVRGNQAKLGLTMAQRRFIVRHEQAGGCAGWMMVVATGNDEYVIDCSLRMPSSGVLSLR